MTIVLLLSSGVVQASEWLSLGKTDNGRSEIFVDVTSVRVDGGISRGMSKVILAPHTQAGTGEFATKWVSYITYRFAFNCREAESRVEGFSVYFEDGAKYEDPAIHYPKPWKAVSPGFRSNWTALMQFVCAGKPIRHELVGGGN